MARLDALAREQARGHGRVNAGRYTYGHHGIAIKHWGEAASLTIGSFCSIADRCVVFLGGNHRTDWVTTYPFTSFSEAWPTAAGIEGHPATKGEVTIGNDVWIGSDVTIMSGVTIGDGAVVAARSTVIGDVPPYAVVGGNPAQTLRRRFSDSQVEALLAIRWWEWPDERIAANAGLLCSDNVDEFVAANRPPGDFE